MLLNAITLLAVFTSTFAVETPTLKHPNILVIIADDLGFGDLSCYGNKSFITPNIDRLAKEGVQLIHHVSAAAICTPSRAAMLTGRYPVRYGLQEARRGPRVIHNVFSRDGLPTTETTFGRALLDAGYKTKFVGKWHVGWSCENWYDQCHGPLGHGFESFFGMVIGPVGFVFPGARVQRAYEQFRDTVLVEVFCDRCDKLRFTKASGRCYEKPQSGFGNQTNTCSMAAAEERWKKWLEGIRQNRTIGAAPDLFDFGHNLLVRDTGVEEWPLSLPGMTQRLVNESVEFIHSSAKKNDGPFLLVHSLLHPHVPMFTAPEFDGYSNHSRYADNILEMDWAVGELLDSLDVAGVAEDTIVHFVSDHGGWLGMVGSDGEREGGSNYPFQGGKPQGGMEGGIRVPGIFRWPGRIPGGREVDVPTSTMDLFPTILDTAGVRHDHLTLDGKSILGLLQGSTDVTPHQFMFHYCASDIHAVRFSPLGEISVYKLYLKMPNYVDEASQLCKGLSCSCYGDDVVELSVPKLFDIHNDPSEKREIPGNDERYKRHVPGMLAALVRQKEANIGISSQHEDFDLWAMQPALLPWDQLEKFAGIRREEERVPLARGAEGTLSV